VLTRVLSPPILYVHHGAIDPYGDRGVLTRVLSPPILYVHHGAIPTGKGGVLTRVLSPPIFMYVHHGAIPTGKGGALTRAMSPPLLSHGTSVRVPPGRSECLQYVHTPSCILFLFVSFLLWNKRNFWRRKTFAESFGIKGFHINFSLQNTYFKGTFLSRQPKRSDEIRAPKISKLRHENNMIRRASHCFATLT
jgi:hypothetical protein